jgi:hypothetical protein
MKVNNLISYPINNPSGAGYCFLAALNLKATFKQKGKNVGKRKKKCSLLFPVIKFRYLQTRQFDHTEKFFYL